MRVAIDAPAYIVAKDARENSSYRPRTGRWYLTEVAVDINLPGDPVGLAMVENPMTAKLYDSKQEAQADAKLFGGYVMEVAAAGGRV